MENQFGSNILNNLLTEKERLALLHVRRGYTNSRAGVSRCLKISRPTASIIIEKLIGLGAIREVGLGKSSRGKSPMILSAVEGFQYTIGLDLSYSHQLVGVLLDGRNQIVKTAELEYDNTSLESIHEKSLEMIETLSRRHTVVGLGVAVTGSVNPMNCEITQSVNPVFASNPLWSLLGQWTHLPVRVVNHPRSALFSEVVGGVGHMQKNAILFSLGETLGNAFAGDGVLFLGVKGNAGELKGVRLSDGRTLVQALEKEPLSNYSEDELVAICADGFGQVMDILDLRFCILSGGFTELGKGFLKKLNAALSKETECCVRFSQYGKFTAARGCALHVAERVLKADYMI